MLEEAQRLEVVILVSVHNVLWEELNWHVYHPFLLNAMLTLACHSLASYI